MLFFVLLYREVSIVFHGLSADLHRHRTVA